MELCNCPICIRDREKEKSDAEFKGVPGALPAYRSLIPLPGLPAGTVFVHDRYDLNLGSYAFGCLKLAWHKEDCQHGTFCGHTFILPGQFAACLKWFEPIDNRNGDYK